MRGPCNKAFRAASPGAAAGGCGLRSTRIALQPIAAHVVHGPMAREGNSRDKRHSVSSVSSVFSGSMLYRVGLTTVINECDVTG